MPASSSVDPLRPDAPARSVALGHALRAARAAYDALDRIVRVAALSLGAPVARVRIASGERQFTVASTGGEGGRGTAAGDAYSARVAATGEPLLVGDARRPVGAYAGVPLIVGEGLVLGTLEVIDPAPREWSDRDRDLLALLAGLVVDQLRRGGLGERELLHLSALMESTDDAVIGVDLDGTVTSWNPGAERMLGFRPEEVLGAPVLQLAPAECRPEVRRALRGLARGEPVPQSETERLASDGSRVAVSRRVVPVRDLTGRVVGATVVLRDIRSRVELHRELESSAARFRSLIEHSTEIITVLDAAGRIRYDSRAVQRILGYSPGERVGAHVLDFVHPDDRARVEERLAHALQSPEPTLVECRARHRDGSYRILASTGVNLLDDPAVRGIVVNARDVTELRQGERRLRHAQKLEAIGRLAGGIAHDFNNVLTAITGTAQLLLMDLPEESPWREDVAEIDRACTRAAALTRQLLTFSREQVLRPELLDLNAVISEAERMLRRTMGEDIEFVSRLEPELWQVRADRGQIEQILMNLAVNARDAMPRGGRLTTSTRNLRWTEAPAGSDAELVEPGEYVELVVSDTGTGMREEVRQRIFEPFFTTKPAGKGTGLGLATTYGIVKQSGGYIWAESERGRGTAFTVLLPRALPAAPLPAGGGPRAAGVRGAVLLVDDDPAVRGVAKRVLQRAGFEVLEAGGGEEALALAGRREGRLDLLFTDVAMPGMAGGELAHRLGRLHPRLRVLFASGGADTLGGQGRGPPSGTAFIQKPYAPEELIRKISELMQGAE